MSKIQEWDIKDLGNQITGSSYNISHPLSIFNSNLSNTKPISLIKHIKKLYTKLLTNCLNLTFSQHNILPPFNFIALTGNSYSIPIHIFNNIIEDANCNSNQLWLLSQDMSKAYNFVNFKLFTMLQML